MSTPAIDIFDTDDIEDDLAIFGGQTRVLDRKGKQAQAQSQSQPQTPPQPQPNLQSNPLLKSPFSYTYLQPQSHQSHQSSSSGSSSGSPTAEPDLSQVHPSLVSYVNHEQARTPGPQNVTPLTGGDGGRFFPTQLESQSPGHLISQLTNLADRREYGGRARRMAGLNSNSGMNPLGSEYFNTSQVQQRPAPGGGYRNPPLNDTNVLGGYPNPGYGYGNPSSDNTNHMLPVNIGSVPMGGRTAEVDTGYVPTYTFRTSGGMNAVDPAGAEMSLSSESGMDAGWLTFMRDCGIMDVTEDR